MSALPYLPLFVDDYDGATAHLTIEEDGAYLRLLRLCWRTPGCSIPDEPAWIMRKLRVDLAAFDRVVSPILEEFFSRSRGRYFQKRLREEFGRSTKLSQARKNAGKKGGTNKALNSKGKTSGKATDLPEQKASKDLASKPIPIPTVIEIPSESLVSRTEARGGDADHPPLRDEPAEAFAAYEEMRHRIDPTARAATLSPDRRKKLVARMTEIGGSEGWNRLLGIIGASPFLRGESSRTGKMVATIDWLLEPKNIRKVLEGNYDDNGRKGSGPRVRSGPIAAFGAVLANLDSDRPQLSLPE